MVTKRSPNVQLEYSAEQIPESRLFTAKSVLTIKPKKEHHNTTFICQAQNAADRTYQSAKIKLYVKYAPKVRIFLDSSPAAPSFKFHPQTADVNI